MKVAIVYATREGQTRRIAEYLAGAFFARGVAADLFDSADSREPHLADYGLLVLAGSVHIGKHERELVGFVKRHRKELDSIPTAFVSVSLSQAGVESVARDPAQHAQSVKSVAGIFEHFFRETGWFPRWVQPVAGALMYTRYKPLTRFVLKMISKRAGGSTDTSRDHEYTNWSALERFVERILRELGMSVASQPAV